MDIQIKIPDEQAKLEFTSLVKSLKDEQKLELLGRFLDRAYASDKSYWDKPGPFKTLVDAEISRGVKAWVDANHGALHTLNDKAPLKRFLASCCGRLTSRDGKEII